MVATVVLVLRARHLVLEHAVVTPSLPSNTRPFVLLPLSATSRAMKIGLVEDNAPSLRARVSFPTLPDACKQDRDKAQKERPKAP